MRLGCFGFAKDVETIEKAGYDSAELNICETVAMSEAEFSEFSRRCRGTALGFEVFSGCMPLSERIHDEGFDREHWMEHFRRGAYRTAKLGCRIWPFGAGKCRSIPQGKDRAECEERVRLFVKDLCVILQKEGIALVVEPLGPANSNYLQTIGDTAAFTAGVGEKNCFVMCDMRHMVKSGDAFSEIIKYRDVIRHAHIDYPLGDDRLFPKEGDGYDYVPYLEALKRAGYEGILGVEATEYTDMLADSAASTTLLRKLTAAD